MAHLLPTLHSLGPFPQFFGHPAKLWDLPPPLPPRRPDLTPTLVENLCEPMRAFLCFLLFFLTSRRRLTPTFDGGSRRQFSEPDAQGRGVRGEGKPSPNKLPIPEQYQNRPAGDLTRPGPRPGEFFIYIYICAYICTHIHTHRYIYMHTCTHIHLYDKISKTS